MANVNNLRLTRPAILEELAAYYAMHLQSRISIEELVGMVVFIEYFALPEDRSEMRGSYFNTLASRFSRHDIGRKGMQEVMLDSIFHEVNLGIKPHLLNQSKAVYIKDTVLTDIDPTVKPKMLEFDDELKQTLGGLDNLNRYQRRHQNYFLELSEYIERIYVSIHQFYTHTGHNRQLEALSGCCYGGVPKISSYTCTHIDIQVVVGEVY